MILRQVQAEEQEVAIQVYQSGGEKAVYLIYSEIPQQ
jgi:hypothetical protein